MNHNDDIINYIVGCLLHRKIMLIDEDDTRIDETIMDLIDSEDDWKSFYEDIQNNINDSIEDIDN
jgi:hypothetical protein